MLMVLQFCMQEVTARPVSYRSGSWRPSVQAEKKHNKTDRNEKPRDSPVPVLEEGKKDAPLNLIINTHSQRLSTSLKNETVTLTVAIFNLQFDKFFIHGYLTPSGSIEDNNEVSLSQHSKNVSINSSISEYVVITIIEPRKFQVQEKKNDKDLLQTPERLSKGQKLSNALLIGANTAFAHAVPQHREIDGTSPVVLRENVHASHAGAIAEENLDGVALIFLSVLPLRHETLERLYWLHIDELLPMDRLKRRTTSIFARESWNEL
ncbi:hypothetical protein K0M31_003090 [Melipona bicolor]|uniref:Uncharacterized protein n=1 Tax=Melipona bicolor TaxID=60889 RepID=A0AA40G0D3_9HYME|nr:hypothetical protein K0M31_003090 [Melipona bicolor]